MTEVIKKIKAMKIPVEDFSNPMCKSYNDTMDEIIKLVESYYPWLGRLQRYDIDQDYTRASMEKEDDGDFVKWDDIEEIINEVPDDSQE